MTVMSGSGRTPRVPGWVLVLGLSMAPLVAVGLGRFAYALVLPAMREDLGWSYGLAGSLNSATAVGYLVGALTTTTVAAWWGVGRAVTVGTLIVVVTVFLTGLFASWPMLMVVRFMAGMAGAWAFIGGANLVGAADEPGRQPETLVGLYFGGVGLGAVVSGIAVPVVVEQLGWRSGWWVLGGIAGAALIPLVLSVGALRQPVPLPGAPTGRSGSVRLGWQLAPTMVAYFLFGLGYIAYMTFAVALAEDTVAADAVAEVLWISLGIGAFVAAFVWPRLFTRLPGGPTLGIVLLVNAAAAALLAGVATVPAVVVSAVLFGGCLTSAVGAVTMIARSVLPSEALLAGLSALTVAFAAGQIAGPSLFGWLADGLGLESAVLMSAGVLLVGGVAAGLHRGEAPSVRWPRRRRLDPKERRLSKVDVFASLPDRSIRKIAPLFDEVQLAPGQRLAILGAHRRHLYLVTEGRVSASTIDAIVGDPRNRSRVVYTAETLARVLVLDTRQVDRAASLAPGLGALLRATANPGVLHLDGIGTGGTHSVPTVPPMG